MVIPDIIIVTALPSSFLSTNFIPYAVIIGQSVPAQSPPINLPNNIKPNDGAKPTIKFEIAKPAKSVVKSFFLSQETVKDIIGIPKIADASA